MVPGVVGQLRHIVWDWNGTLLDDNHAVLAGVNAVCAEFGRPAITLDEWRRVFRRPVTSSYEELLGRDLDDDAWPAIDARFHNGYCELLPTCGLAQGIPDMLHDWLALGGRQSLLSMAFHDDVVSQVADFGITELFGRIDGRPDRVGGDSKAGYLAQHLRAQHVDPSEVVLIGDVVDDATAATEMGAHCVLVGTGVGDPEALRRTGMPVAGSVTDAMSLVAPSFAASSR